MDNKMEKRKSQYFIANRINIVLHNFRFKRDNVFFLKKKKKKKETQDH